MSQTLQQWMKFFYITGTSVKVFFDDSLLSILTATSLCLYIAAIAGAFVFFDYDSISEASSNVKLLLIFFRWIIWFGTKLVVFTVVMKTKVEREFWETVSEVENIFKRQLREDFICGRFNKVCGFKIITVTTFILCELPVIFSLFLNENGKVLTSVLILVIFKTILRIFHVKYTFYVDVLHVCLKNIESKLQKREKMRLEDLKILKKAYNCSFTIEVHRAIKL
jgi:hypothetical protein